MTQRGPTPRRARPRATPARKRVGPVPRGVHAVTPQLTVRDAARATDFYRRASGARELLRMTGPDGRLTHVEIRIADSILFLADEAPERGNRPPESLGGNSGSFHVYVPDVDRALRRAVGAGARARMPLAGMRWGDRYGKPADPFGHEWGLATRVEELTPAQQRTRAEAFFKQAGQHG